MAKKRVDPNKPPFMQISSEACNALSSQTDEIAGKTIKALIDWFYYDADPEQYLDMGTSQGLIFSFAMQAAEKQREKYKAMCEKNAENRNKKDAKSQIEDFVNKHW